MIADALLGIAGQGIDYVIQKKLAEQQFQYQQQLAAQQNNFNVGNYVMQRNDERSWNNESAVVARRRQAGLNPVSDAAGSSAVSASVGSAGLPSAPSMSWHGGTGQLLQNAFAQYWQNKQTEKQLDSIDADTDLKRAQAESLRGETKPAKSQMAVNESVKRLNDATRGLTDARSLTEGATFQLRQFEAGLAQVDGLMRHLDYRSAVSKVTVRQGSQKVSLPRFLVGGLVEGYEVLERMNRSKSSYYAADIDRQRAANWFSEFKATIDNIKSQIRLRAGQSAAQDFENALRRELRDYEKESRKQSFRHTVGVLGTQADRSGTFMDTLGWVIGNVSPFSGVSQSIKTFMP